MPAAVVGAFPEPFLNGIEGKRLPVRVECATVSGNACSTVTAALRELAVPAAIAAIGSGGAPETLRVMVGPWHRSGATWRREHRARTGRERRVRALLRQRAGAHAARRAGRPGGR